MSHYSIIEKSTGRIWKTANGRSRWKTSGHAKSAWRHTYNRDMRELSETHEIVKINSQVEKLLHDKLKDLYVNYECGEEPDKVLLECLKLVEEL